MSQYLFIYMNLISILMKLFWMINYIIQASFVTILHNAAKIALPISKSGLCGNTAHIKARTGAFRRDLKKLCKKSI